MATTAETPTSAPQPETNVPLEVDETVSNTPLFKPKLTDGIVLDH